VLSDARRVVARALIIAAAVLPAFIVLFETAGAKRW
jgi:hypothetical protein